MSNLYIYLFRSRHKDNTDIAGFKPRSLAILEYRENENHITEEFVNFAKRGLPGEKTRLYKSVNSRNEDKIRHNFAIKLIKDMPKIPMLNNAIVSVAMKAECRDESRWLFDFDIDDENILQNFIKDIPVKTEITKTPHGYAIVCEHGFDARDLYKKWDTEFKTDYISLKRDDMLFIDMLTNI